MFNDRYGLTNAVLEGRKTQTRRIEFDEYLQAEALDADAIGYGQGCCEMWWNGRILHQIPSRYKVGEVVAVAQNYKSIFEGDCRRVKEGKTMFNLPIQNVCDQPGWGNKMFVRADLMPHRIRITDVRVERLQDISDEDCMDEGITYDQYDMEYDCGDMFDYPYNDGDAFDTAREAYAALIDKVSGKGTWESDPYVFVYDFELV